jgi:hypothetical protein
MMRGTVDTRMRQRHSRAFNTGNVQHDKPASQQHAGTSGNSATELDNCLDQYLKSLGYCARKHHLHWVV